MIHYLPLENLKERYSVMMNNIVAPLCDYVYYPDIEEQTITKGQFLDIENTIRFKAKQIEMISDAFRRGKIVSGDKILVADIFYPGLESIKYMAELQDIDVKIYGFNYAGRADENDFVRKLSSWSDSAEKTYHLVCDKIFVGCENHRQLVCKYFNIPLSKVYATGYVWSNEYAWSIYPYSEHKIDQVIFPHRLSNEKGIAEFQTIAKALPDKRFIVTSGKQNEILINLPANVEVMFGITKSEYYKELSKSKVYLSCAYQETFGYTLREALLYDCIPVVPDRVSYIEYVPEQNRYNTIDQAIELISTATTIPYKYKQLKNNNIEEILKLVNE